MQKVKRKQSKDEENDSSSRKRTKADLSKPVSFVSTAAMTEPESSRSRPEGAYDVFLSFRGEDTRMTFTDHLYTALVQAGIHTFRDDDELPRGEEISDHLLRAIQESKISIVVFSKGYASSRWCLNELVEILKCKNMKTGQIVLPIFYDIDPSDVRKQNGSFAEAFVKHEERFEEKLVKEWRKALEEAGNLSGWNLNDMANGHEAKFIKGIIKDLLNRLDPKHLNVPEHLVGIDPLCHDIFDFLSTATDDVRIVGIHGMPGIGKTTIAKVLFNQLCYGFEGSCFLSNINETSKQFNGLALLQKQLLHDILKKDAANINCDDRGKVLIKERLRRKRVLVVADDVARQDQLNALMGERSWFGPGSIVIITTRDSNLLREADQTYWINELTRDQSLRLFTWHAFKDTKPAEDYIELSKKAVDYCGGLPLALEVIGALLYRKNRGEWESEIDNLSRIPNQDIQRKLLISFHALDGELQRAFLDIACFFIGIEKEYVAKVLGARCRLNPEVVLKTLRERSLIQFHVCNIKDERQLFGEMVAMHDLLRDMGREVVCKESPLHLGKRTRIWNKDDAWNVLDHQKGTDVVEGLALDVRASEAKSLSAGSFANMKFLNLLHINGVHLTGSFKLLSKELMWICWHECPLKYFPSDFTLDNLVVLDMQYSNLKELWKGKKILNRLKILNLSHSQHLIKTPNLHSSSLEKLILEGCSSLVEVHQSIGNLTSLVFLNLEGCWRLKNLPESIGNVKSLETLNISGCSQLEKLPERMSDMESLTELLADGIENEQCLSSIGQLKYVRRLSLRGYSSAPPSSSLISAGVLNWKRWLPASFIEWISVKCLELFNGGLSDRATKYVDQLCSPTIKNDVIMDDVQNIVREKTEPVASMSEQSNAMLNKLAGDDGRIQVGVQGMEQGAEEELICSHPEAESGMEYTFEGFIQNVDRNVSPERARLMENNSGRLVQPCTSASSTKLVGQAFQQNMKVIWSWLMDDEVSTIGIYGMGGVGKTAMLQHISNELLERRNISNSVYWVNVPQGFRIKELQDLIAKDLHLDLSRINQDLSRAEKLAKELAKKQNWILILDDLWNSFEPQEVGIPISLKGSKLIMTTRSEMVCWQMNSRNNIRVDPLSDEEAWTLFKEKLRHDRPLSLEVERIVVDVARECAGLPLGIVTLAENLRGVDDLHEWSITLKRLKESNFWDMEDQIFKKLRLSYDCLDDSARQCFVYCALFDEHHKIEREELIESFIEEGIINEMSRQAALDKGHSILDRLENVCLLERIDGGSVVKMHNLLRDMAIQILDEYSLVMG